MKDAIAIGIIVLAVGFAFNGGCSAKIKVECEPVTSEVQQ